MNVATCNDVVNSYTCGCVAGYMGTDCETGLSLTLTSTGSLSVLFDAVQKQLVEAHCPRDIMI